MKKIIVFIFIYLTFNTLPMNFEFMGRFNFITQKVYAQENLKINSINFDNSDSIIFLGTSSTENFEDIKITKKTLSEPDRIFFDIENSIITFPNKTFEIKNGRLQQLRIAQNSVDPNVVRIVMWTNPNYDSSHIKVLKIKNNIILKLNNEIPLQPYLTQIYRETESGAVDYYDKTTVVLEEKIQSDEIFEKVQQAFQQDSNELVRPNIEQKQAKLKSRFYLDDVSIRNGNIVLSGIGVVNTKKPFVLQEPSRVVFDLPNTITRQELREKEIKISETETVKIGQFSPSVARIVIKTQTPYDYHNIYSNNLQSIIIAKDDNLSFLKSTIPLSKLTYFKEQNVNIQTNVINISFSNPILHSIKRESNKISLILYNLTQFDVNSFNNVANANQTGFQAKLIAPNTYQISFPLKNNELVDCYETLNASQLRLVFTMPKTNIIEPEQRQVLKIPEVKKHVEIKKENLSDYLAEKIVIKKQKKDKPKEVVTIPNKIKNKVIVIDPGHGGNDTGALRNGVLEKDLTLDIALQLKEILKCSGFKKVLMTRTTDTTLSLAERVDYANSKKADIYISIHINASVKSEINGIETHYYSEKGYNVAKVMHEELISQVGATDRGLFKSKFYVINHTEAPAVLLELGFISNEKERNSLTSEKRQKDSAQAIADGIINYLTE